MSAKNSWSKETLERMIEGRMSEQESFLMQTQPKDPDRFERVLEIMQERVPWPEKIMVPLGEHLYVVENMNGERIVKCDCGHEFGDYRENWKLNALVFSRDNMEKLNEIYVGNRACDPGWMILREYYCPGCATMLETEAVTPGYPVIFNFLPDFEAFEANKKK